MLVSAFDGPLRRAVTALWLAGGALAGSTGLVAAIRLGLASAIPFLVVAVALVLLAGGTFRRARWALAVSLVLLGVQLLGILGSAWELGRGDDSAKARQLEALGFDPTFGVVLNLAFSAVAFGTFLWALSRIATIRRREPAGGESPLGGS